MSRRDLGNVKKAEEEFLKVTSLCCFDFSDEYQDIDELQLHCYCERQLGELHPDYVALTHELACFYRSTGDPRAALPLHQRALGLALAIGLDQPILSTYACAVRETEQACKHDLFRD